MSADHIDDHLEHFSPSAQETQALATFDTRHAELSQLVRPGMTLRFLRARGLNIDQAAAMIGAHMEWREQMQPDAITVAPGSGLDICDRSGYWRYLHNTPDGTPVVYCSVGLWNPHEYAQEDYIQFAALQAVRTERIMTLTGSTQHIAIVDLTGWAMWHGSYIGYQKQMASIAQNHFPERVSTVLLLNSPFMFRGAWKVISQFLGENTTSKIHFVNDQQAAAMYEQLGVDPQIVANWEQMPVPGWPE